VEVVFALLLLAVVATIVLFVVGFVAENRALVYLAPVLMVVAIVATIMVNNERQEEQRKKFGEVTVAYLSDVQEAQASYFEENGSYATDIEALEVTAPKYDGGVLQTEEVLEPSLTAKKTEYSINGSMRAEEFTLQVTGPPSEAAEERTCSGSSAGPCQDGTWQAG